MNVFSPQNITRTLRRIEHSTPENMRNAKTRILAMECAFHRVDLSPWRKRIAKLTKDATND